MRSPRVLALDFGAERVACGIFSTSATGRIVLQRFAFESLRINGRNESWQQGTMRAIGTLATRENIRGCVQVTLPGHLARTKYIATPAVHSEKRRRVLEFEAAENFPYPLEEMLWDSAVLTDDGLDLEATLAAAKLESIQALCAAAERSGLTIERAVPVAFALLHGFRHNYPEVRDSVIVANIGARSTNLLFLEGEQFRFRAFALGGEFVTRSIAHELGLEFSRAEIHKLHVLQGRSEMPADAPARQAVQRATAAFASQLHLELTRSILHQRRQSGISAPTTVYLTGGGSLLPELAPMLHEKLHVPILSYQALRKIDVAADARAAGADAASAQLADLVGLGAALLLKAEADVNLVPSRARAALAFRRRQPWILAAVALVVIGLLGPIKWFHRRAESSGREIVRLEEQLRPMRLLEARNRENLNELELAKQQIAGLRLAYATQTNWLKFFDDLQSRLVRVEDVWFETLQIARAVPMTGAPERNEPSVEVNATPPLELTVTGRLLDVANPQSRVSRESVQRVQRMLESFAASPFIAAVKNERFDNTQHGLLRFDFTLVLKPGNAL